MDISGRATTDPALGGLIVPACGQKGSGLVLTTGLLSTFLTGAAYGTRLGHVEDGPNAGAVGQSFMVINPAAFDTTGSWNTQPAWKTKFLKAGRLRRGPAAGPPGVEPDGGLREGSIPLNQETIKNIRAGR